MLWNIFRQIPEVAAYYEPLHEKLPQWIVAGVPPQTGHCHVDTYFREYPPVEELKQYHRAEFGVCRLYLEADEPYPQLQRYIRFMLDSTPAGQIPVLQFNRVDFRLAWLKVNFPGVPIIHLYRSARDQWRSAIADYPENIDDDIDADPYLITTWARDLCQQFPFLAGSCIRHAYQRHYYLWKLSYLAGSRLADMSVSYEDMLTFPEKTISSLLHAVGLDNRENLERGLAIIVQKPTDTWKQYRSPEWFLTLEQECEATLTKLGLTQSFGKKSLAEIVANTCDYQKYIAAPKVHAWAIGNNQLSVIKQEIIAEEKELVIQEKEQVIQELHTLCDERLQIIQYLNHHPWRVVLKRYLPKSVYSSLRQIRRWVQPKLGQLQHHPPIPFIIPEHYDVSPALSQQALPVVSLVTPSLNQAQFLERTIKSVLDQRYPKLEYIIQDGVSTDETAQILEDYRPHLKHIESSQDNGQAHAINLGFRHAGGEVMAWLNADDLLLPGAVAYIVDFFLAHPEVDVVYGHRIMINEDDQEVGRWILPRHDQDMLLWADYIPQETLFWRRSIWEKAGGYVNESYHFALDWELLLRFRDAGATFVRLPRFLAAFRVHDDQKTSQELKDRGFQEMHRLREQYHGRHVSHQEAHYQIRSYMRKQVLYDLGYRSGILRY